MYPSGINTNYENYSFDINARLENWYFAVFLASRRVNDLVKTLMRNGNDFVYISSRYINILRI